MTVGNRLSQLTVSGPASMWVLVVNVAVAAVAGGIVWGNLSSQVDNLRYQIERERAQQLQSNSDQNHRLDALQANILDLMKEINKK
jgi:hypothetical protein